MVLLLGEPWSTNHVLERPLLGEAGLGAVPSRLSLFLWHVLAMFTNHHLVLGRALLTMRPGGQDAPDMMGALKPLLNT